MIQALKENPLFGYIHLEKVELSETAALAGSIEEYEIENNLKKKGE
jgi:hypothetical protein